MEVCFPQKLVKMIDLGKTPIDFRHKGKGHTRTHTWCLKKLVQIQFHDHSSTKRSLWDHFEVVFGGMNLISLLKKSNSTTILCHIAGSLNQIFFPGNEDEVSNHVFSQHLKPCVQIFKFQQKNYREEGTVTHRFICL